MEHFSLPNNEPNRRNRCFSRECGMTMIEILISIGIIAVLAALIFPAISAIQKRTETARCMGNLRQVGTAMLQMAADQGGVLRHWYMGNQIKGVVNHWVAQLNDGRYLTLQEMECLRCSAVSKSFAVNVRNWGFNLADPQGVVSNSTDPQATSTTKVYRIAVNLHPSPSRSVLLAGVSAGEQAEAGTGAVLRIFKTGLSSAGRIQLPHDGKGEMFFLDGHAEIATPHRLSEISETFGASNPSQPVEYYDESHALQKSPAL